MRPETCAVFIFLDNTPEPLVDWWLFLFSFSLFNGQILCTGMVFGWAALASPGNLWQMQIFRSISDLPNQKLCCWWSAIFFNKLPKVILKPTKVWAPLNYTIKLPPLLALPPKAHQVEWVLLWLSKKV